MSCSSRADGEHSPHQSSSSNVPGSRSRTAIGKHPNPPFQGSRTSLRLHPERTGSTGRAARSRRCGAVAEIGGKGGGGNGEGGGAGRSNRGYHGSRVSTAVAGDLRSAHHPLYTRKEVGRRRSANSD